MPTGIDIGREQIHICHANETASPRDWPVRIIKMTDNRWWNKLLESVPAGDIVTLESTGAHISRPVIEVLKRAGCKIYLTPGSQTNAAREQFAAAKTDAMDARALASIAERIAAGKPPRGCRPPRPAKHQYEINKLRIAVNNYTRAEKEVTRNTNRLRAYAYAINPAFSHRWKTYEYCLKNGAITVRQCEELLLKTKMHGNRRHAIEQMLENPPPIEEEPEIVKMIEEAWQTREKKTQERDEAEKEIEEALKPFSTWCKRWAHMPGGHIGAYAAVIISTGASIEEMTQDEFVAACGVNAVTKSSGKRDKTGRIIRTGYAPARRYLYVWAMTLMKPNMPPNPVTKWAMDKQRTVWQVRTKLARVLYGMARDDEEEK